MTLSERRRDWLVTGAFVLVIGGLVVAGWLTRDRSVVPRTGAAAPALELALLDGDTAMLSDYRGQVVLLNLWATWCPPCVREMPSMQRVYDRYREGGLEIVAISVDARPGEPGPDGRIEGLVSEFVDRFGLTFPVALDPTGGTERMLGVNNLPTTFLIDRAGRIRVREVGGRYWDEEPYVAMIEALLKERDR